MTTTTPRHIAVTIDVRDLETMSTFWSTLLGVESQIHEPFAFLAPGGDGRVAIWLQRVPEERRGKNRLHLDFVTDDLEATERRIVELGGGIGDRQNWDRFEWRICTDPEGNVFDVMRNPGD